MQVFYIIGFYIAPHTCYNITDFVSVFVHRNYIAAGRLLF